MIQWDLATALDHVYCDFRQGCLLLDNDVGRERFVIGGLRTNCPESRKQKFSNTCHNWPSVRTFLVFVIFCVISYFIGSFNIFFFGDQPGITVLRVIGVAFCLFQSAEAEKLAD